MNLQALNPEALDKLEQRLLGEQRKRVARQSLMGWCRYCGFEPARHHQFIIQHLEKVVTGEIDRLAIFAPPGSAKSTYASSLFPPYYYAHHPSDAIIAASHTAELAEKWGRRVRNLVAEHKDVLKVGLAPDSQAAGRWETDKQGEYYAAGIGGTVAGRRADIAIIDDPIRSREDADSEVIREKIWEWYVADLYPRLKPRARIVLIQTRWHEDDLAGRLLNVMERGGDKWTVISLPAVAEENDALNRAPGEPLWPEWQDGKELSRIRQTIGAREWSALYQQRPTPDSGNYFLDDWFRPYTHHPDLSTLHIYGGSDYAVTDGGGDYTVHVVVGVDPQDKLWLLDLWRGQTSSDIWVEKLCDMIERWKPVGWAEESGQIRSAMEPLIRKRMMERKTYVARRQFPAKHNKTITAQAIRGRMAMYGLHVPMRASWYPNFRGELLSFPAGRNDDQTDAMAKIGLILDLMVKGEAPKEPEKSHILSTDPASCTVTLDDVWSEHERGRSKLTGRI